MKNKLLYFLWGIILFIIFMCLYRVFDSCSRPPREVREKTIKNLEKAYRNAGFTGQLSDFTFAYGGVDRVPLASFTYSEKIADQEVKIDVQIRGIDFKESDLPISFGIPQPTNTRELVDEFYDDTLHDILSYGYRNNDYAKIFKQEIEDSIAKMSQTLDHDLFLKNIYYGTDRYSFNLAEKAEDSEKIVTLVESNLQNGKTSLAGFYDLNVKDLVENRFIYIAIDLEDIIGSKSMVDSIDQINYNKYIDALSETDLPDGFYSLSFRYVDEKDLNHYENIKLNICIDDGQARIFSK